MRPVYQKLDLLEIKFSTLRRLQNLEDVYFSLASDVITYAVLEHSVFEVEFHMIL